MRNKIIISILLVFLVNACIVNEMPISKTTQALAQDVKEAQTTYIPIVANSSLSSACSPSRLGSILFTESTSGESTGPYLQDLTLEGYTGLTASPTYDLAAEYFPKLPGWDRTFVCNSLDCLTNRAQRAHDENLPYEYLAYDPERHDGVPPEEKYNLPWATQTAREIADEWGKPLIISYSTKQLHQEAEERGYYWDDPSAVVAMLAPYGDVWLIQAADEYWRLEDNTIRPILSQRVYPPGAEFRAQVQRWVDWIHAANPDIKIWIQLAPQRIGVVGENQPSADLLLGYRNSILDLVDGIYITTIYGSVEQLPPANQAMVDVFHRACVTEGVASSTPPSNPAQVGKIATITPSSESRVPLASSTILLPIVTHTTTPVPPGAINLVEQGWTDNLTVPDLTILPGYYYRIYENTNYPCGTEGNHQFLVLDQGMDLNQPKNLFVKFPGGSVGFYYVDGTGQRVYYPNERAVGLLTAQYFENMFFRTTVSSEFANGVTKRIRENASFRIMVPSYCSHDLYHGTGEYDPIDGFSRYGFLAAMSAVDYVQQHFNTLKLITYGGSAGAAGSFYIGKDQDNVAGIIMDSQAVDLSAISDACHDGFNVFGGSYPCFCPEGAGTCMEVLAPRIGFTFNQDEPYRYVETGFNKPIYLVWNERDASIYAHLQYDNLHNAIVTYNPGSNSIANKVCITDPRSEPGPICNLHVPSAYDYEETIPLVDEIYAWILSLVDLK